MFHLAINRIQSGPFTETDVRARLARGELGPGDLCWSEGWPQWRKVAEVFPTAQPPPIPAAQPASTYAAAPGPATSGLAIGSLICGICTFVLFPFFFLAAPAAVILGHVAKSRIKHSGGTQTGGGLATAGLWLGYGGGTLLLALIATGAALVYSTSHRESQESAVRENLALLWGAAEQQLLETGAETATYDQLVGEGKRLQSAALKPVAGEDYRGIVIHKNDTYLMATLGDGRTVEYDAGRVAGGTIEDTETEEPGSADTAEPEAATGSEDQDTPPAGDGTRAPAAEPRTAAPVPAFR
jgi:hypothetical protein